MEEMREEEEQNSSERVKGAMGISRAAYKVRSPPSGLGLTAD